MAFRFTDHALAEMARREIPRELAEQVLAAPEQRFGVTGGRMVYQSRTRGAGGKMYLIRLIVDPNETPSAVITAYRTSKIDKYWRPDESDV